MSEHPAVHHQDGFLPANDAPSDESSSAIDDDDNSVLGSVSVKSVKFELAQKETKLVFRSRVIFSVFLGIVAVTMGISTYRVSVDVEDGDFETRFDDFARQVIEVSQINARNIFERYQTMGLQLTAYSLDTQKEWPFVQMPRFGAQSSVTALATGAEYFLFAPVVEAEQREMYEEFAMNHRDWIQDSLDYSKIPANASDFVIAPTLFPVDRERDLLSVLPFHVPVAQITSVEKLSVYVNGDVGTDDNLDVAYKIMNETRSSVMSGIFQPFRERSNPASFLATPIFNSFDDDAHIVGVFSGFLYWDKNFEKLLPPDSEPLILVVQNCDEFITFQIDGPEVTYLGYGDQYRDLKYDTLERQGTFAPYQSSTGCDFIIHIYPTEEFEAAYRTNDPLVKTLAITVCFFVTALLFFFYNFVVEYRQTKLVQGARQNSKLVGSLFPEEVRDRLVEYAGNKEQVSHIPSPIADVASPLASAPIADRFEFATVFFADIAGFTKWSSDRDPEKVFILLETLYNSFDQIARRLGVFKVETIGDCYMAVTGLPKVRDNHAAIMVKFARACLTRMSQLLPMLEESLGEGTMALSMRIGMHSGPVTAGVLRGEKSRFQLFGDTVNTASRMESNGQPGRIHVSSATADELIRLGKSKWLTPRNDAIVAKGKGAMKTFWVNFGNVSTGLTTFTQSDQDGVASIQAPDDAVSTDDTFNENVSVNGTLYV